MKACILVIVKDEHEYLGDFLRYHLDFGIDRIYVMEDVRSASHKEITDRYPDVELCSIRDIIPDACAVRSRAHFQAAYIRECLMWVRAHSDCDWCFVLDCDEFVTTDGCGLEVLGEYARYDAVLLQWRNYGCSGHLRKPVYDRPIWEIYTEECGYSEFDKRGGFIQKVCFNMRRLKMEYICGSHFTKGNWVKTDFSRDIHKQCFDRMWIRHYITKSLEEFEWKLKKRGMMYPGHRSMKDFWEMQPEYKK